MTSKRRIIINTFGSFGDVHPYMSLALELQARGHAPVLATMDYYREKIQDAGLEFAAVRPNIQQPKEQDQELIDKIMEPKSGPKFLTEEIIHPAIPESYADLLEVTKGADLLITHPAAPAGPLVGYKTGIPWISTVLAPLSFFSAYDSPVPPFWQWTKNFQVLGPRFMKFMLDTMKSKYKAKAMDRRPLRLPGGRRATASRRWNLQKREAGLEGRLWGLVDAASRYLPPSALSFALSSRLCRAALLR